MALTLDSWEAKFGDNSKFNQSSRVGFDYELGVAYPVKIKVAKVIKNKREEIVLQLDLLVQDAARDSQLGSSREWITLPKQPTDEKISPDTVRKLTLRRRDDLQRIMSLTDINASVYAERVMENGRPRYKDAQGQVMDASALRAREKEVNEYVMSQSDDWHDQVGKVLEDLQDAEFFLVKAPNKKNADYPYTNIYNVVPTTAPLVGEDKDTTF